MHKKTRPATTAPRAIAITTTLSVASLTVTATPGTAAESHDVHESDAPESNAVELFLGATAFEGALDPSIGLLYERRIGAGFGIGPLVEKAVESDSREWVLAMPLVFHAGEHWKVVLAPGTEINDGDFTYLTRIGAAYGFELQRLELSPELNFDFVGGDVKTVFGVSLGWDF